MFVWNWWGVPGVVAMVLALVAAVVVYRASPTGKQNRRLAVVFFFEGVGTGTATGLLYFMDEARWAYAMQALGIFCFLLLPFLYTYFLATLDAPFLRVLRNPVGTALIFAAATGMAVLWFSRPELFLTGVHETDFARWEGIDGPLIPTVFRFLLLFYIVAFVAALLVMRQAPTPTKRRQARDFAIAFGARDVLRALLLASLILWPYGTAADWRSIIGVPVSAFIFFPLLAYGVLASQLFDIDLRIKATFRQSLVGSAFVLAFFSVSELAEALVSDAAGPWFGLAAAAALTFAVRPLERAASRIVEGVMPGVASTPDYIHGRKVEVYRAAVEGIGEDGVVTSRERDILERLRAKLALGADEAAAVEREMFRKPVRETV